MDLLKIFENSEKVVRFEPARSTARNALKVIALWVARKALSLAGLSGLAQEISRHRGFLQGQYLLTVAGRYARIDLPNSESEWAQWQQGLKTPDWRGGLPSGRQS